MKLQSETSFERACIRMTRNLDSPASTVAIEIAGNPGGIAYMSLQQLRDVLLEAELLDNAYVNLNPPSHAAAN